MDRIVRVHSEQSIQVPEVVQNQEFLVQAETVVFLNSDDLTKIGDNISQVQSLLTEGVIKVLQKNKYYILDNQLKGAERLIIVLGQGKTTRKDGFEGGQKLFQVLKAQLENFENVTLNVSSSFSNEYFLDLVYALAHSNFDFKLKSRLPDQNSDQKFIKKLSLFFRDQGELSVPLHRILVQAESDQFARLLSNTRPNIANPEYMYERAVEIQKEFSDRVEIKFLRGKEIEQNGLNLLYSVGKGSRNEPYVVSLFYRGDKEDPNNVFSLIGKGVCYDSGGLSIKTVNTEIMHHDKGGACVALAVFRGAVKLGLKVNIAMTIGLVENMPDGNAYRVSDIITSLKGYTVEILNTDAEGRLLLADILTYNQWNYKPHTVFDYATLTGACMVALGFKTSAIFSNNDQIAQELHNLQTNELLWRLPLTDESRECIVSTQADIANIGKYPQGGAINGATFLEKFIENGVNWVHFDIAGACARQLEGNQSRNSLQYLINKYAQ